jgi:hypothetical protein
VYGPLDRTANGIGQITSTADAMEWAVTPPEGQLTDQLDGFEASFDVK